MSNLINKIKDTFKKKAPDAPKENNAISFWSDKRAVTAVEFVLYILLSVVLVATLMTLIVPGLNTIWTSVMAKITDTLS